LAQSHASKGGLPDLGVSSEAVFRLDSMSFAPGTVLIRDGLVLGLQDSMLREPFPLARFGDSLILPGLVDLHGHPGTEGCFSVDPDSYFLRRGTTAVLAQGEAGSAAWESYRDGVIQTAGTRIALALNASAEGYPSASNHRSYCIEHVEDIDVDACVAAIDEGRDVIWGISLCTSIGPGACAPSVDPMKAMERTLRVAETAGCPILLGTRMKDDWPLESQLSLLRPGDVVTYCFHSFAQGILRDGRIRDSVWRARERGVLFDLGFGTVSFSYQVAEAAVQQGFWPDTISSDLHSRHVGRMPQHDLPLVLSIAIAAGIPESEAFLAVTRRPAEILGLSEPIGVLEPGRIADLTVLDKSNDLVELRDGEGVLRGGHRYSVRAAFRSGEQVEVL